MIGYVLEGLRKDIEAQILRSKEGCLLIKWDQHAIQRKLHFEVCSYIYELVAKDKAPSEFVPFGIAYADTQIGHWIESKEREYQYGLSQE